ncbi:MAG: hypothetical protein DRJ60_00045 [Thermoprotei archaeon]|nr:MAG: hypothetical protein DRJ60_00045 [Thermoprotei archaeon]
MRFVKKRGGWRVLNLHAVVVAVTAEAKELASALKEMARILKDVRRKVYDASEEAFEEAMREVGISEWAVPSVFRPTMVFTVDAPLGSLASAVEKGVDDMYVHEFMLDILDSASYDQGETNMIQKLIPIADPRVIEKYRPELKTALKEVSSLLYGIKAAADMALRRCNKLLGRKSEYFSCIAENLRTQLPRIRRDAEEVKPESIKEELKEVYKAVLEHGKKYGLGEYPYWY